MRIKMIDAPARLFSQRRAEVDDVAGLTKATKFAGSRARAIVGMDARSTACVLSASGGQRFRPSNS